MLFLRIGGVLLGWSVTRFRTGFGADCGLNLLKGTDGCVDLDSILACALRPVEGAVGGSEKLPLAVPGAELGDAEAAGDGHDLPAAADRRPLGETFAHAVGELGRPGCFGSG